MFWWITFERRRERTTAECPQIISSQGGIVDGCIDKTYTTLHYLLTTSIVWPYIPSLLLQRSLYSIHLSTINNKLEKCHKWEQMTSRSSRQSLVMTDAAIAVWSIHSGPVLVLAMSFVSNVLVFIGKLKVLYCAVLCCTSVYLKYCNVCPMHTTSTRLLDW